MEIPQESKNTYNLLNSIKSKYTLKNIFSYLNINQKLDLIKYNKNIQKNLQIDNEYCKWKI